MRATFTTLYERGRYSSRGRQLDLDDDARKQRTEQQERFAVSMIRFALEHDADFKTHFLDKICDLNDSSAVDDWEVLVEPENWGDLVLKNRRLSSLTVAEFKILAELRAHQDPTNPGFISESRDGVPSGYGWEIDRFAKKEKWDHLRYVTVEKESSWSKCDKRNENLCCVPAEWKQLLRANSCEESKLETDVYDCLARFGVHIFLARSMINMKLGSEATKPLSLLIGVLAELSSGFNRNVEFREKKFLAPPSQ